MANAPPRARESTTARNRSPVRRRRLPLGFLRAWRRHRAGDAGVRHGFVGLSRLAPVVFARLARPMLPYDGLGAAPRPDLFPTDRSSFWPGPSSGCSCVAPPPSYGFQSRQILDWVKTALREPQAGHV